MGKWDTSPVNLEVKSGPKSFNARCYEVHRTNNWKLYKELILLFQIGVITPIEQLEYGNIIFTITKKEGTASFFTGYRKLIQKFVRKTYPLPRIDYTMQQLEVLQYITYLDLNIVYYTIYISTKSHYLKNIITEFVKFRYNKVPMRLCASGDIFQAKVEELLSDIKGAKTYMNVIMLLVKWIF